MKMKFFLCSYMSFLLCGYLAFQFMYSFLIKTTFDEIYFLLPLIFGDLITATLVSIHYMKNNAEKKYIQIKLMLINISGCVVSLVAFDFSMIVRWCIGMSGM